VPAPKTGADEQICLLNRRVRTRCGCVLYHILSSLADGKICVCARCGKAAFLNPGLSLVSPVSRSARRDIPAMRHSISSDYRCTGYHQPREYYRISNQCLHVWQENNTAAHRIALPLDPWFPGNGYVSQIAVRHVDGCSATRFPWFTHNFTHLSRAKAVYK
jgi:hypothetical protein